MFEKPKQRQALDQYQSALAAWTDEQKELTAVLEMSWCGCRVCWIRYTR